MQSRITIVDYGMGNLRSVQKKFIRVGANVQVSRDPNIISMADKLILPGVGHFANGIKNLKEYGLWEILNSKVLVEKTPILGICLGMQLMAKNSEEGDAEGLGWFDADVVKFRMKNSLKYKVPHMGWNNALLNKESLLFKDVPDDIAFYFVHSYHIKCHVVQDILATTEYEYQFTSAIQKDHIFGTQFHPEKSLHYGMDILMKFSEI